MVESRRCGVEVGRWGYVKARGGGIGLFDVDGYGAGSEGLVGKRLRQRAWS